MFVVWAAFPRRHCNFWTISATATVILRDEV